MIESKRNSQKGVCIFMGRHRRERGIFRELLGWLLYILIIIGLTYVIITYVGQRTRVSGQSMETTLSDGDNLIVDKLTYHFKDPERFDIVIFKYPDDPSQLFVKRVIGLPGETVNIVDGKVYINDSEEPLDDSFCPETPQGSFGPYEVPEGCYFMLGDNRNHSMDSRYWMNTFVEKDAIEAEVAIRYWPLNKIGTVN